MTDLRALAWDEGADFVARHPGMTAEYIRAANPYRTETKMNDINTLVLIYRNDDGELFEQRATDLVSSGTLSDADTGEDLELIGWRTNNA